MAYPTDPVTFIEVMPGENRTDVATMLGTEITGIETALLHPAAQTAAPIRMRGGGNQIEWGPAAPGRLSTLGSTGGKSFVGLGCEAGSVAGKFTTRAQKGIVLTHDGAGGLLIQAVPVAGAADQTPVTLFTIPKSGWPLANKPILGSWNGSIATAGAGAYVNAQPLTTSVDPYTFYTANATGDFKVPVGLAGWYLWIVSVSWTANGAGNRLVKITMPSAVVYPDWRLPDPDGGTFSQQCVATRNMLDGDVCNVAVGQTSGVALTATVNVRMLRLF